MKKLILITLVSTLTLSGYAQQSCPLTNSKLTDLRTAASKLSKTITLSAECKSYEETVNQANAQLKEIALKIADSDEKEGEASPEEKPGLANTAAQAITQLDTIGTLLSDQKCGTQIVGFLDYASVFVDVATNMTPFLALYGGPAAMPWVLGPAIGGAAAKSIIAFFKNKSINMRDPDQSNSFLKNSCAFYSLNQIKDSLDDLELRQSTAIENQLRESKKKLSQLLSQAPKEPSSDIIDLLKQAEKDQNRIKFLQEQMKFDAAEGCSYIKAYASKQDPVEGSGTLVERVWQNYEQTLLETPFRHELEENFFIHDLNAAVASGVDAAKCTRWLTKMNAMIDSGIAVLNKKITEENTMKSFKLWQEEKLKLETDIKHQEARLKFFNELTGDGFNIEYSEIIRSHEQVQDSLFNSYRWLKTLKMKGLAEIWLRIKREDADLEMKAFKERKKEVEGRMQELAKIIGAEFSHTNVVKFSTEYYQTHDREHHRAHRHVVRDVCNQLRKTWISWYNGSVHAKAGRDYCVAFSRVIDKMDYPEVQKLCFGTTTRFRKKRIHSLKNQVQDFYELRHDAESVLKKMKDLSCQEGTELTTEMLSVKII